MAELTIEVAFATPDKQQIVSISLPQGSTVADAVLASGLSEKFPDVDLAGLKKGVWNQVRPDDYVLQDGDRVEIYRPLIVDAKTARRNRVREREAVKKKEKKTS